MLQPLLELISLSISCVCPPGLLVPIINLAINVRKLVIGMNCVVNDDLFDKVFVENKLQYLEEFEVRSSTELTMKTVSRLLLYANNIRSIMDLSCWDKVSSEEFLELMEHMKASNIELELSETIDRHVSLYEICQSQLKERYQRVDWFNGD